MGAEQPNQGKTNINTGFNPFPVILVMMILLVSGTLVLKTFFANEGDTPKLSPKEEARLTRKLREIDDAEQYALLARYDGFYPCLHSGFQIYYLKAGNVWKYGVTTKGEKGRYSPKFLMANNVAYLVQFKGNIAECLKQEQIQLFMYPFLPENLERLPEIRLSRPPYNPIMR